MPRCCCCKLSMSIGPPSSPVASLSFHTYCTVCLSHSFLLPSSTNCRTYSSAPVCMGNRKEEHTHSPVHIRTSRNVGTSEREQYAPVLLRHCRCLSIMPFVRYAVASLAFLYLFFTKLCKHRNISLYNYNTHTHAVFLFFRLIIPNFVFVGLCQQ